MKTCPKCNELIGDELKTCSICGYEFTKEELDAVKRQQQEAEYAEYVRSKERQVKGAKKRTLFGWLMFASIVAPFLAALLLSIFIKVTPVMIVVAVIVAMVCFFTVLIIGMVTGGFSCPHCGRMLYRNHQERCQYCGKKL